MRGLGVHLWRQWRTAPRTGVCQTGVRLAPQSWSPWALATRGKQTLPRLQPGRDAFERQPPTEDLLDGVPTADLEMSLGSEEFGEDDEPEDPAKSAGPLARKMWNSARRGVRSHEVWSKYAQRVLMTPLLRTGDVALMFIAFARIKYRDRKALDTISPFLLSHLGSFNTTELVLLLNAHKKLEYERLDNIQLLTNEICNRHQEWTGRHIALAANAVAYFYVYLPRFWRLVAQCLPEKVWSMNALELSNLVSGLARVDRRDPRSLVLIARMCRRCAKRNLFSQETLATSINSFAKLDFNHPKLAKTFEEAVVQKLDRALDMGPDYRKSSLRNVDVFDVQALVLLLHTLVCLVGTSDEVVERLLTLISWSRGELSDYQRRTLKTTIVVLRKQHGALYGRLPPAVKDTLYVVEKTETRVSTFEPRWAAEVRRVLKRMDITVEARPVVDDQVLDILLPTSNAVVYPMGPFSYYASTTHRTAYSKLHQRLLELEGYKVLAVPYYEWSELQTEEDKMVYLWSQGRRAAHQEGGGASEAAPSEVQEDLLSDLSDVGEARSQS